jgi:hypothetical protein
MPKKKKQVPETPQVQIVFRVPQDLYQALQAAAAGLAVDLSNLLRMLVREHVAEYVARGQRAAAALEQARAEVAQAAAPEQAQEPSRVPSLPHGRRHIQLAPGGRASELPAAVGTGGAPGGVEGAGSATGREGT